MKNKLLAINSFSFQASVPPYSTSYLIGYLKSEDREISQLDINLMVWNELLSHDYLKEIYYNASLLGELDCPFCQTLQKEEFELLKIDVLEKISIANTIIKSKDMYDFNQFCYAQKIYFDALTLIYHQYGTFFTTHLPYWGNHIGFDYNNIENIYKIANDEKRNPLVSIYRNKILPLIKQIKPDIIFIEIMFPFDIVGALTLNTLIKEQLPQTHINYSGISFDEFNFSRLRDNLKTDHKFLCKFDSVFLYRDDKGILKLIDNIGNKVELSDIDNLVYNYNNNVIFNNITESQPYDDGIIPDYSDLDLKKYFVPETVFVDRLSTRCFWAKCSFCSINAHKNIHKQLHKINKTVEKIKIMQKKYGVKYFWFLDEACPMGHATKFAKELKKNNIKIIWSLRTRIDEKMTKDTLQELYDSGLRELWVGLEHVNEEIIEKMNKTEDASSYKYQAASILNNAASVGIGIHFCHILGFPSETTEQREEIIEFYVDNKEALKKVPFFGTLNTFGLAVDSPIYKEPEKYGITSVSIPVDSFVITHVPYITKWNDQTSNPKVLNDIEDFSNRLMKHFADNSMLEYIWAVVADSPYELLFKANLTNNPFLS